MRDDGCRLRVPRDARDGLAPARRARDAARAGRDADLHAGRHARRRQGRDCRATCARSAREIVLGNTYHLYLRPGDELIARRGGLHRFMGWDGPILTDSGGYQVFSLGDRCRLSEEGARVPLASRRQRAPADAGVGRRTSRRGSASDIAMVLDECTPFPATPDVAARSLERTARWAARARARHLAIAAGATDVVPLDAGAGAVRHRAGRRPRRPAPRPAPRPRSPSASRATPSAASASASRST